MSETLPSVVMAAHASAITAGQSGYLDPRTGLFVMTSAFLKGRGWCCGNGCRHCPWPPEEQRRAGRKPQPQETP